MQTINRATESDRSSCLILQRDVIERAATLQTNRHVLAYKTAKDADGFVPELSNKVQATFGSYQVQCRCTDGVCT